MRRSPSSLLLTALLPAIVFAAPAQAQAPPSRTLTVTAGGEVQVVPDRAVVQLGIQTRASNAQAAMTQNNTAMGQLLAALKGLGIPEANLQTSVLSLQPIYNPPPPENPNQLPQLVGFEATNILSVELTDLTRVAPVIDAGITAGANQVVGIGFRVADEERHRLAALRDAVAHARPKAEVLAASAGVTLGDLDAILEVNYQAIPFATKSVAAADLATPIQPGTVTVRADVQLRYFIR